jgi:hypothetical protein
LEWTLTERILLLLTKWNRELKAETFEAKEFIQGRDKRWIKAVLKTLDALPAGKNFIECRQDYMEFLQSCCPLYGSCFFFVEASQMYMYMHIIIGNVSQL